eukprot:TRINITY_DN10734_c0_g1_i1.p1 TRINITY_DN10734_c0_g1~~TRINITY_DN10734_c0_g1_i1.p1  ORF type:complete len:505 (+),score=140.94 TRINITY_DN10734_c0_g1_i1:89-1516(+)
MAGGGGGSKLQFIAVPPNLGAFAHSRLYFARILDQIAARLAAPVKRVVLVVDYTLVCCDERRVVKEVVPVGSLGEAAVSVRRDGPRVLKQLWLPVHQQCDIVLQQEELAGMVSQGALEELVFVLSELRQLSGGAPLAVRDQGQEDLSAEAELDTYLADDPEAELFDAGWIAPPPPPPPPAAVRAASPSHPPAGEPLLRPAAAAPPRPVRYQPLEQPPRQQQQQQQQQQGRPPPPAPPQPCAAPPPPRPVPVEESAGEWADAPAGCPRGRQLFEDMGTQYLVRRVGEMWLNRPPPAAAAPAHPAPPHTAWSSLQGPPPAAGRSAAPAACGAAPPPPAAAGDQQSPPRRPSRTPPPPLDTGIAVAERAATEALAADAPEVDIAMYNLLRPSRRTPATRGAQVPDGARRAGAPGVEQRQLIRAEFWRHYMHEYDRRMSLSYPRPRPGAQAAASAAAGRKSPALRRPPGVGLAAAGRLR